MGSRMSREHTRREARGRIGIQANVARPAGHGKCRKRGVAVFQRRLDDGLYDLLVCGRHRVVRLAPHCIKQRHAGLLGGDAAGRQLRLHTRPAL